MKHCASCICKSMAALEDVELGEGILAAKIVLRGKMQTHKALEVRQAFVYALRTTTDLSYPRIGRLIGRDHSTAINAFQQAEKRLRDPDPERNFRFRDLINRITKTILENDRLAA